jgi:acyl-CoA thioester hydrolase
MLGVRRACTLGGDARRLRSIAPDPPALSPVTRASLQPSRDPADYAFHHRLRTRFAETDAMGVVHHAAYLPYLEEARVEYLRAVGRPYGAVRAGTGHAGDEETAEGAAAREFPVLEVSVRYRKPLVFDEEVTVSLVVGAATRASFQIAYVLTVEGGVRATAVTVHGCVDAQHRPVALPEWMRLLVPA